MWESSRFTGADSPSMQDFETLCFQNRADWVRLLLAYSQAEDAAALAEAALQKAAAKLAAKAGVPAAISADSPMVSKPAVVLGTESDGDDSATGWVARVSLLDGVDAAQMSALHGRVIALGYLKFKLVDRQVGLRYRLTPAGKQMAQSRPDATESAAA